MEIEPLWEVIKWRLNGEGTAKFSMSMLDAKCTTGNLRPGNRLLVQFDNGLPDWGGVIDLPRKRQSGQVAITAYSAARLLNWRRTGRSRYFDQSPPGHIFRRLIEYENREYPTGIEVSEIYSGGTPRSLEYHYHDLLQRIKDLARLTGHDFAITPAYTGGKLRFLANWYARQGKDKRNSVWLLEGANVEKTTLDEQGMIANRVILVGEGTTWGDERLEAIEEDAGSIDLYGYREYAEIQAGVVHQGTLDANAEELLAAMARPTNMIGLTAVDAPPGRFADYDIGDTVGVKLFTNSTEWYFDSAARVIARAWNGATCELEVEEVKE